MKIGLGSYAFRWAFKSGLRIADFLQRAADLGAEVVQLCENSAIDDLPEEDLEELKALARNLEIAVECGGSGAADLVKLERAIRRTAALDGIIYRCVLDSDGVAPDQVVTNLRQLLPTLRDCGVVLCAENHFRFTPQTLRRIVEEVDDAAVGICLDPLNSIAQWVGPEETVRTLLPYARTAHVKDALIERSGASFTIVGVPLGEGQMDLTAYIAAVLPQVESLLVESWMPPIDGEGGQHTFDKEIQWAGNGLALLRDLANRNRSAPSGQSQ